MSFANNNNTDTKEDDKKEELIPDEKLQNFSLISHQPEALGEAMPVYLSNGASALILDYLDGDLKYLPEASVKKPFSREERQQFTLFGVSAPNLVASQAKEVARLLLQGEEKEIEEALDLVKKHPNVLRCQVVAEDRLGRAVRGTPFQIAAMAGDVDLKVDLTEEKDRGAVERLILAGSLSREEIIEQLKVVTSQEAEEANEARNKHILSAIITFGKSLMEIKADAGMSFEAFQTRCQEPIAQLEKYLQPNAKEPITMGYIFDLKILQYAARWFEIKVEHFGNWWSFQSDIFWVNGFGKLQSKLSSRDAQVVRVGIGNYVEGGRIPPRTLTNADGTSYFLDSSSRLGRDYYLGYYFAPLVGWRDGWRLVWGDGAEAAWEKKHIALGNLMSSKNSSIAKLMQPASASQLNQSRCLLM